VRTTLVGDAGDASALHGGAASPSARRRVSVRSADPPDDELVRRIGAGDQASMAALYDRYARPSYSLARRICADDGIAQDVVQEAFLAFWRDTSRFDSTKGSFGTWLLTLVHHKSVDAVRRESALRKRTVPASGDGDEWSAPPGPGADQAADSLTFIGTATTLIRLGGFTLLTDPNFLHRAACLPRQGVVEPAAHGAGDDPRRASSARRRRAVPPAR